MTNILVFYTDQQRADSLGCMGNTLARTPHLDRLSGRGILYTRHYAANPVCMPSRASFITGRYPQAHGLIENGNFLPERELTMPEVFRQHGYRTASFGKLHFQTMKAYEGDASHESMGRWNSGELDGWDGPYYGFEKVGLTTGHGEGCTGHYGRWRAKHYPDLALGYEHRQGEPGYPQFSSWKSNLPLEAHHSTWVAQQAMEFLETVGKQPFYLNVSFPDPHHPLTPPAPYHSMFDGVSFPAPHAVPGENETKPKPYRMAMSSNPFPTDGGARYRPDLAGEAYQQVHAHTYGMISLIDDCIGQVLAKLESLGLAGNTIVVFTSDHGDFMGDHGFLHKGQMPCRSLLNVPLIIAVPGQTAGRVDVPVSNVDVMPTLLQACGIDIPSCVQGVPLPAAGESARRAYAYEEGWSKASPEYHHFTIYTQDWRLSVFPNLRDGELYDLVNDPWEHHNLFHEAGFLPVRKELMEELLFAVGAAGTPNPAVVTDW